MSLALIALAGGALLAVHAKTAADLQATERQAARFQAGNTGYHFINIGPAFRDREHAARAKQLGERLVPQGLPDEGQFLDAEDTWPGQPRATSDAIGAYTGDIAQDAAIRIEAENRRRALRTYWRQAPNVMRPTDEELYGPNFHLRGDTSRSLLTF